MCRDLMTDAQACGCCGNACGRDQTCNHGHCDSAEPFGFFVVGDMHSGPSSNNETIGQAFKQMQQIDSSAIAIFNNGDLLDTPSEAQWAEHDALLVSGGVAGNLVCGDRFGEKTRYFAGLGDHDVSTGNWRTAWDAHLNSMGAYYSLTFAGALFIVLDAEHASSDATSWLDEQTKWLDAALKGADAQDKRLKFMMFHEPVYSCSNHHAPFAAGLPWVDLAERNGVNVIFGSHTHVYSRSCPRVKGQCTSDDTGIVYVETGTLGGAPRALDTTDASVTGIDSGGIGRTDTYDCVIGRGLRASRGMTHDFCHVRVDGCQATVNCYEVSEDNVSPFDTWTVNGCV
jgi:hypothetical protein